VLGQSTTWYPSMSMGRRAGRIFMAGGRKGGGGKERVWLLIYKSVAGLAILYPT
jgi:hypothetical protein